MVESKNKYVLLAVMFIALLLFPTLGFDFYNDMVSRIVILALFAVSLDLLVGYAGLISFGHAAWFGVGAYAFALLSTHYQVTDSFWITLPVALIAAAVLSFIVGLFVLRTKGIYFIMVTLAFAQVFYFLVHDVPAIGGSTDGLNLYARPTLEIGNWVLLDLENPLTMYYFILAALFFSVVLLWFFLRSPLGRAVQGIKINEHRMLSIGFPVFRYKLIVFVIASVFASLAGYLFAAQSYGVNPELLSWHKSADVLLMLIFGGMGQFVGGIVGAFAFILLKDVFMTYTDWWQLWLGITIVLFVLFLPGGLASLPSRFKALVGKA
ncbi:branched-chain amino acid ABC transporter permease [Neopusillimonas maritima]|jgi:branched-chain amino acid transport system permease protein|uniref:Branched-chain amino acid ABC transporter permease n=1 Tax=Neopusillimonas maritima TaxID=2026239 RepID=A0ABX9MV55_9BURK|nr:branched-chain amino acid ABC transporter permease [Neopusillimonas maritima]MAO52410.1 branched-chain amino acid ABC transporter permease [Pusillimonas sp.]MBC42081.1 branched-chain amino acid ABC transporter permease [Pusillimonas sp.]MBF22166.1 branched-chain amino acid ABC transporter permease [Pusillimonas sp.]RII82463.1 branched-chain amino acid ABC transporter permease [Neopusillimonas maritima]HCN73778.1 branched-chain amino acid ABC transporter permease [Pusillimonas sp.]|tara:strand:+ start:138257 stop:139222 length:966 start_codon:yes stop_codon:yes gene_type:complete